MIPLNTFSQADTTIYNTQILVQTLGATENCDIYLLDSKLMKDVTIVGISDSLFYINKEGFNTRSFGINGLKKVTFKNHAFWPGALYGFAGTVALMGVLGLVTYRKGGHPDYGPFAGFFIGAVFGIPVGVISGVIAEFAAEDDVYTFPGNNFNAKQKRLKYILQKHKK